MVVNGDDENSPYFLSFWSEEQLIYTTNTEFNSNVFMENGGEDKILKIAISIILVMFPPQPMALLLNFRITP